MNVLIDIGGKYFIIFIPGEEKWCNKKGARGLRKRLNKMEKLNQREVIFIPELRIKRLRVFPDAEKNDKI